MEILIVSQPMLFKNPSSRKNFIVCLTTALAVLIRPRILGQPFWFSHERNCNFLVTIVAYELDLVYYLWMQFRITMKLTYTLMPFLFLEGLLRQLVSYIRAIKPGNRLVSYLAIAIQWREKQELVSSDKTKIQYWQGSRLSVK